jgi:hypothetical protein
LFLGVLLASPAAVAATEGVSAWPIAIADSLSAASAPGLSFDWRGAAPAADEAQETDGGLFAVSAALLEGVGKSESAAPVRDRFVWVIPLIAFAGLTAMFGHKRSGGRGLIAA